MTETSAPMLVVCASLVVLGGCVPSSSDTPFLMALAKMDIQAATPWALCHLTLVAPDDYILRLGAGTLTLGEALRRPMGAYAPLLGPKDASLGEARRGQFVYEYEDHYCQYAAYDAMRRGLAQDEESSSEQWGALNSVFLEASRSLPNEELSWYLVLGAWCWRKEERAPVKTLIADALARGRKKALNTSNLSCAHVHYGIAALLCQAVPCEKEIQGAEHAAVAAIRQAIAGALSQSGYAYIAGLHNDSFLVNYEDEVRVIGHTAEFLAFAGPPYSAGEQQVFVRLKALLDSPHLDPHNSRLLGAFCHAANAQRRLSQGDE